MSAMRASRLLGMSAFICVISFLGCGGDDATGQDLTVTGGGVDPGTKSAMENMKIKPPKDDPNFEKMAGQNTRNRARDIGASSGGGTSTAILD